jgi:chromosome segregation ATPase
MTEPTTSAAAFRQIDQLTGYIAELTTERDTARAALESVHCQCAQLSAERDHLQDQVGELLYRNDLLAAEIAALRTQLDNSAQQIQNLRWQQ